MSGKFEITWSTDSKTGDLIGSASVYGADGQPRTISARVNKAALRSQFVKRYAPHLAGVSGDIAISGSIFDDIGSAVDSIAKSQVINDLGKAAQQIMRSAPAALPSIPLSQIVMHSPDMAKTVSAALAPALGPAASLFSPQVMQAAGKLLHGVQNKHPHAVQQVNAIVAKAQQGDKASASLKNLFEALLKPASTVIKSAAPAAAPDYLSQLQSAAAGACAEAMRAGDAVVWKAGADYFAISGESDFYSIGANLPATATQLIDRVAQKIQSGDAKATHFLAILQSNAAKGDAAAKRMYDAIAHAVALAKTKAEAALPSEHAPPAAVSGASTWHSPMNLENYYTISGLRIPPFYGDNVVDVDGGVDIVTGADGRQLQRQWDGSRWIYVEAPGQVEASSSGGSFGLRDAYLLGIKQQQARAVRAHARY
jgi:hypothetical protein